MARATGRSGNIGGPPRSHDLVASSQPAHWIVNKLTTAVLKPNCAVSWRHHQNAVQAYANRVNLIRAQYHHIDLAGGLDQTVEARPPLL
ncbi:hypothetical protein V5799_013353, partial [Amblyomma americanum]